MDGLQCRGILQALRCTPQQGAAGGHENQPQHQRGGGLDTGVTVWVVVIRILGAMAVGEQHQKVAQQVGEGVHTIGDQGRGLADDANHDLQHGQYHIHRNADPGHFLRRLVTLGSRIRFHKAHAIHSIMNPHFNPDAT